MGSVRDIARKSVSLFFSITLVVGLCPGFAFATEGSSGVGQASTTDPTQSSNGVSLIAGKVANKGDEFALRALAADGGTIVQVALGVSHSAALKSDGTLWMWGMYNDYGQLGYVDAGKAPTKVMDEVAYVALGSCTSAAIKKDGSLWMWGIGGADMFGYDDAPITSAVPIKVMEGVSQVSLGVWHCAAIKDDGSLWMWGSNDCGQIGVGNKGSWPSGPGPVKIMDGVSQVSLGEDHSAAVKQDGTLWVWGKNNKGEIGDGSYRREFTLVDYCVCQPVMVMSDVKKVVLGGNSSAAIKNDGSLWTWGELPEMAGDLRTTTADYASPTKVMEGVADFSFSQSGSNVPAYGAAALKTDGSLWTWGWYNDKGLLGDGSNTSFSEPKKIIDGNVSAVTMGPINSAAIKQDGSLWVWGAGSYYGFDTQDVSRYVCSPYCVFRNGDWLYGEGPSADSLSDTPDEEPTITFYANNTKKSNVDARVKFGANLFKGDPKTYNHDLAKLSITLSEVAYSESIKSNSTLAYDKVRTHAGKVGVITTGVSTSQSSSGKVQRTARATYDDEAIYESYIYNAFGNLGIDDDDVRVYYYRNSEYSWGKGFYTNANRYTDEGGFGTCGYALGTRKIVVNGVSRDLVIVMIRGTASNGEWNSDFNIANAGPQADHRGFKEAEEQVMDSLVDFCEAKSLSPDTTTMLITGHSRGAGVANLLAGELDNTQELVKRDSLYAYTFASPRVSTRSGMRDKAKYGNIFNIVNPEDFVTKVALEYWGYDRYGVDKVLPSRSNRGILAYQRALNRCNNGDEANEVKGFRDYFGTVYQPYLAGAHEVWVLVDSIYAVAPSVSEVYRPTLLSTRTGSLAYYLANTPYDYFQSLASYLAEDNKTNLAALAARSVSAYRHIFAFFVLEEYLVGWIPDEIDKSLNGHVFNAHQGETYFAWMFAYSSDDGLYTQSEGLSTQSAGGGLATQDAGVDELLYDNPFKVQRIYGDADVRVYDSAGSLVCSIKDGAVDELVMENGLAAGVLDSGEKVIYIPSGDTYRFEIEEKAGASMTVESYDGVEELQQRTDVMQLPHSDGVYHESVGNELSSLTVASASGTEMPVQVRAAAALQTCQIDLARDGSGSVWGGGERHVGDLVTLHAEADEGNDFSGWYVGSQRVSGDAAYSFRATGDVKVTGKFTVQSSSSGNGSGAGSGNESGSGGESNGNTSGAGGSNESGAGSGGGSGGNAPGASGVGPMAAAKASLASAAISGVAPKVYDGTAQKQPGLVVKLGGRTLEAGTDYAVSYSDNVRAGTATVTVAGRGGYTGSKSATFAIAKAAGALEVTTRARELSASSLAEGAKPVFPVVVRRACGAVSYKKVGGSKRLSVGKGGHVVVAKGTPAGTYKAKVRVSAAGGPNYEPASRTVTATVRVTGSVKAASSAKNLEQLGVKFDLKKGKAARIYVSHSTLDSLKKYAQGRPYKFGIAKQPFTVKVTSCKVKAAKKKGYRQATLTVEFSSSWKPSSKVAKGVLDANQAPDCGGSALGQLCAVVADYSTGVNLEAKNAYGVTAKSVWGKARQTKKYYPDGSSGGWVRFIASQKCTVTVTYPASYTGLCFGCGGEVVVANGGGYDAYHNTDQWELDQDFFKTSSTKLPYTKTSYFKKGKSNFHFMRIK